jgi:2-C-methyl-D-erythritol 2,4-cyclodiphosphate synthase
MNYKIGIGTDAHKFSNDGYLTLGTLKINDYKKLDADSDGDVVVHAVIDAILSALKKGDIGSVFGVGKNSQGANISSREALKNTLELAKPNKIQSVAINIITSKVKIKPYKQKMEDALEQIIGGQVSITATTTDGFFANENKGIFVVANCLLTG